MFIKLFISLILLSSLSYDGISNLPSNIYDLYIYTVNGGSVQHTPKLSSHNFEASEDSNNFQGVRALKGNFVLSYNAVQKFETSTKPGLTGQFLPLCSSGFNCVSSDFCTSDFNFQSAVYFYGSDKDFIISKSDTSPPSSSL